MPQRLLETRESHDLPDVLIHLTHRRGAPSPGLPPDIAGLTPWDRQASILYNRTVRYGRPFDTDWTAAGRDGRCHGAVGRRWTERAGLMQSSWSIVLKFDRGLDGRPDRMDILRLTQKLTGAGKVVSDTDPNPIVIRGLGVFADSGDDAVNRARRLVDAEWPGVNVQVAGGVGSSW